LIQEHPKIPENTTEVLYGIENAVGRGVQFMQNVKEKMDLCGDKNGPSIIMEFEEVYKNNYIDVKRRGWKIRLITDITKENIHYCKELMKIVDELRHLDGIKGGIAVSESEYMGTLSLIEKQLLTQIIYSNVSEVVEQQQYIFDALWSKAIPARQRFKEIEEGAKREFIETIRDPYEIQKLIFELVKKAEEEILILFSAVNAFHQQVKIEALEQLKEEVKLRNIKVRILVPTGDNNDDEESIVSERIQEMKDSGVDIRTIKHNFQNKLTTLIIDQSLCLTVELKDGDNDDTKETHDEAIGLATYSNSEATIFTYVSIFENLWIQTQLLHKTR
jgi:two-component system, OmpR family, sensor histidine kinase VicK